MVSVEVVVKEAEETGNSIDYTECISNDFEYDEQDEIQKPTTPKPIEDEISKTWAKKYWYVIFIIVLVVVIMLIIAGVISYVMINKSMKETEQQKTEKIMESVIPIEQVKQENKVTEDDIYNPFSYKIVMEGYLMKEGRDKIVDKWQRRYYGKVYTDEKQSISLSCNSGIEYKDGSN